MKKLNLCGTWEMTGEDGRSFPSEVPGSVLNTLLEHGKIPDPSCPLRINRRNCLKP